MDANTIIELTADQKAHIADEAARTGRPPERILEELVEAHRQHRAAMWTDLSRLIDEGEASGSQRFESDEAFLAAQTDRVTKLRAERKTPSHRESD